MKNTPREPIVLFTDFGTRDQYLGVMKGVILGIHPKAVIVDLCHEVEPQSTTGAAYLLSVSFSYFPRGSLFVSVVDPGVGGPRRILCAWGRDYLFLAPDNGLLTGVKKKKAIDNVHQVTNTGMFLKDVSCTFHGRDIFAPVAARLSLGVPPERVGEETDSMEEIPLPEPGFQDGELRGTVIHVDRFGNLISNIDRAFLDASFARNLDERVVNAGTGRSIPLRGSYQDVPPGVGLAYFGSFGQLEIGVNRGRAEEVFSIGVGGEVRIL